MSAKDAQRTGLQPSARLRDFPNEILEEIFVAAAADPVTKSSGAALMRVSTWVQVWVAPHLYYHVVIRSRFAAASFIQAMASKRSPLLRTLVHTLVVLRCRPTAIFRGFMNDESWDAPYITQIGQILGWLNDPTCLQSWQNLLVHRSLLFSMKTQTWQLPSQLTIIGVGEIRGMCPGFSNVRRLRLPDYMLPFSEAQLMWTRFPSLTHLAMVVYMDSPITRQIVDVLLQSWTLERLAVVITLPSATGRTVRPMGNAIHRELLEVDDERLVVLEEETSLLEVLRQPDGVPFWRRVDEVADHRKKNGKTRPPYVL